MGEVEDELARSYHALRFGALHAWGTVLFDEILMEGVRMENQVEGPEGILEGANDAPKDPKGEKTIPGPVEPPGGKGNLISYEVAYNTAFRLQTPIICY